MILDLPHVTSVTVDDRPSMVERLTEITRWHRTQVRFAREVMFTPKRPRLDGVDWFKQSKWRGRASPCYSQWCLSELKYYFDTSHVLLWQADGFVLDARAWTSDFLAYDYVGSPLPWPPATKDAVHWTVGNGGFSLRSRRFCEVTTKLPPCGEVAEDIYIFIDKRRELRDAGMLFCDVDLAHRFGATWTTDDWCRVPRPSLTGRFGFHGKDAVLEEACELMQNRD